jgi:LCP family protein required for cell wall assembly
MASHDKPYRVYRGGRTKGKVPAVARPGRRAPVRGGGSRRTGGVRSWRPRLRLHRPRSWKLIVLLSLVGLIVLALAWGIAGFFSFRDGVDQANGRLPKTARQALDPGNGFLLSNGTTILLLGLDSADIAARSGDHHTDSMMIVRTDPSKHTIAYLSIPRDLLVTIPSVGSAKINAAYQYGGAALAIKTVEAFTGVAINHVVIVNFDSFKSLIDAEGGITIDVPEKILSNRFDCPYPTQAQCNAWPGWRFKPGIQHMDGERALIYSRIRENQLNPADNDLTREARQQAVAQAAADNLLSFTTFVKMPFIGSELFSPVTTDLTAAQLLELGWVKFRSSTSHALYCRLGGDPADVGNEAVLLPSEDNRSTLLMWDGLSAPQAPTSTYAPGCEVGHPITLGV